MRTVRLPKNKDCYQILMLKRKEITGNVIIKIKVSPSNILLHLGLVTRNLKYIETMVKTFSNIPFKKAL